MTINRPTLKHRRETSPAKVSHREGPAENISPAIRTQEHTENKRPNSQQQPKQPKNPRELKALIDLRNSLNPQANARFQLSLITGPPLGTLLGTISG